MTSKAPSLPDYESPPIAEVACGVRFEPLSRLKLSHIGAFWTALRQEYPSVEHAAPIATPGDLPVVDEATGMPLPRVLFVGKDDSQLVQLQIDRIYFNWRRPPAGSSYPRYPHIVAKFFESLERFQRFTSSEDVGLINPIECELTYINHLVEGEAWKSVSDLSSLFNDFNWNTSAQRDLPMPSALTWQARFSPPGLIGQLTVKLAHAVRKSADRQQLFVFELSARGIGEDTSTAGLKAWMDVAHDWIVRGFADLTTRSAQATLWKRINV